MCRKNAREVVKEDAIIPRVVFLRTAKEVILALLKKLKVKPTKLLVVT
jgi:hypothetical protein